MKKLLRIDEVMEILPYRKSKIYELIQEGKLKAACPNGAGSKPVFITRQSVDEYVDSIIVDENDWKDTEIKQNKGRRIINKGL